MDLDRVLRKENLVYSGKSKDIYLIPAGEYAKKYAFVFTDRGTGYLDANNRPFFDPGYDTVVGEIPGKGAIACKFAAYFFRLFAKKRIPSHYITTVRDDVMIVEPATPISLPVQGPEFEGSAPLLNLEWTWRNNATGSFWRRYPFVRPCQNLSQVVEAWTKGESDKLITFEALVAAGVMTKAEVRWAERFVKRIATVIAEELASKGLHLIDGKLELGRLKSGGGKIVLIDEISPDVLRVCKGYSPDARKNCRRFRECIETSYSGGERKIVGKNQLTAAELERVFLIRKQRP
jgi:phosphoribosylaminoimidazole-succinocarboxamide synthase